jgi:hypothetical protein
MSNQAVPVFMYHSVGIPEKKWVWNYLTCPWQIFESHLKWLKKNNYNTISLSQLYQYIFEENEIPEKSVVLTFDDGYADNYVFAYPLLKKYGFKGTIFVNPDFVDPRTENRKKLGDTNTTDDLETTGFLSWNEMREMECEGVMDMQSHALTHTWYPVSSEIIDFRHPGDTYHWMTWNDHPSQKPFLQLDNPELTRLGAPVYKHEKSLSSSRVFPKPEIEKMLVAFVQLHGGIQFFKIKNWKEILFKQTQQFSEKISASESIGEYHLRIEHELKTSKQLLEQNLNKKVEFLCWPGGSGTKQGALIAERVGYKMSTAAKDITPDLRKKIVNRKSQKYNRIGRLSPVLKTTGSGYEQKTFFVDDFGMWLRIKSFGSRYYIKRTINFLIIIYSKFF